MDIKSEFSKLTHQPVALVVGAIAGYYGAKKYGMTCNLCLLGSSLIGALTLAVVVSAISAKVSTPTVSIINS